MDRTYMEIRDLSVITETYYLHPLAFEDITVPSGDLKADAFNCIWNDWQEHCCVSITNGNVVLKKGKPVELRALDEIMKDINVLESETEGLWAEILK